MSKREEWLFQQFELIRNFAASAGDTLEWGEAAHVISGIVAEVNFVLVALPKQQSGPGPRRPR